jgi:hypothetical protein
MRNAMSYFGSVGVWLPSPDKFTEIDLGPAQQISDVAFQIKRKKNTQQKKF